MKTMANTSSTKSSSDQLCEILMDALISEGVDVQCIVAGAAAYSRQVQRTGERGLPLWQWLANRGWEQHRH